MSGLAAVLAGRVRPGVYQWHAAFDAADVRHTVEHAGWAFGYVDGWRGETREDFLRDVGIALAFPDYYGHNLDALNDCLRDVTTPTVLLWDGWGPFAHRDPRAFGIVLDIFGGRDPEEGDVPLSVLLRGEGPDLATVLSLD